MKKINENRNTTELVERFIGTAYDNVKRVSDNLDVVVQVGEQLTEFSDRFQIAALPPETRASGDPLEDGDRYFNETTNNVYIWSNGDWRTQNAVTSVTEVHTIDSANIVGNDTVVTLAGTYAEGSASLEVHVGGVYQYSTSADPSGGYVETDSRTITFPNVHLAIGEVVTVDVHTSINVVNPVIGVTTGDYLVNTTTQYVIPLPNGMVYSPGNNNLDVHRNGLLLTINNGYIESSPTSITLTTPANPGDRIVFKQGTLLTNNEDSDTEIFLIATSSVFYENREFLKSEYMVVTKGGYAVGDGLGAVYFYDPTADKANANGVTLIDADQPLGVQGDGVGLGCWARNYDGEIFPAWFNSSNVGVNGLRKTKGLNGDACRIFGFYEFSNVGGGDYVWFDDAPSEYHDGGVVISPLVTATPGTIAWYDAPPAGTTGCWLKALDSGQLNMESYGINSNVNVDNGPAFQAAATAAILVDKAVEIPPGTYRCDQAVNGNFYSFGGVIITGTGNVATIKNLLA